MKHATFGDVVVEILPLKEPTLQQRKDVSNGSLVCDVNFDILRESWKWWRTNQSKGERKLRKAQEINLVPSPPCEYLANTAPPRLSATVGLHPRIIGSVWCIHSLCLDSSLEFQGLVAEGFGLVTFVRLYSAIETSDKP